MSGGGGYEVDPEALEPREYARAQLGLREELAPEQVEERVNARLSRQERLRSAQRPLPWAIIDESVLRRPVGSRGSMFKQLAHLLEQVDSPDSKVQVMPFGAGVHYLLGGTLTLLTLPNSSTVAYEEGIEVGHLHEDRDSAKKWRRHYEVLRANALPPAASAELIRNAMEDYKPCSTPPS